MHYILYTFHYNVLKNNIKMFQEVQGNQKLIDEEFNFKKLEVSE